MARHFAPIIRGRSLELVVKKLFVCPLSFDPKTAADHSLHANPDPNSPLAGAAAPLGQGGFNARLTVADDLLAPYRDRLTVAFTPDLKADTAPSHQPLAVIEPLSLAALTNEDLNRLVEIEQDGWDRIGLRLTEQRILERIFGVNQGAGKPNPVMVARVNGKIEGAIFMSFAHVDGDYDRIPKTYEGLIAAHDQTGDTIFDYSVVTNQNDEHIKKLKLFDPLVKSTQEVARLLGKREVIAYSRAEFFMHHAQLNPQFESLRNRYPDNLVEQMAAIGTDLLHEYQSPTMEDYACFFGFEISDRSLARFIEQRSQWVKRYNLACTEEQLRDYFKLANWQEERPGAKAGVSLDYAEFHIRNVGDAFLMRAHQRLGADMVKIIPNSRPADIRGGGANVMMRYKL